MPGTRICTTSPGLMDKARAASALIRPEPGSYDPLMILMDGSCSRYRWSRPKTRTPRGAAWRQRERAASRSTNDSVVCSRNAGDLADGAPARQDSAVRRCWP